MNKTSGDNTKFQSNPLGRLTLYNPNDRITLDKVRPGFLLQL